MSFKMPDARVGDIVYWYDQYESKDPTAAMVTRLGHSALGLTLYPPDTRGGVVKDGVRHCDDPDARKQIGDSGYWKHRDDDKDDLLARLKRLEEITAGL